MNSSWLSTFSACILIACLSVMINVLTPPNCAKWFQQERVFPINADTTEDTAYIHTFILEDGHMEANPGYRGEMTPCITELHKEIISNPASNRRLQISDSTVFAGMQEPSAPRYSKSNCICPYWENCSISGGCSGSCTTTGPTYSLSPFLSLDGREIPYNRIEKQGNLTLFGPNANQLQGSLPSIIGDILYHQTGVMDYLGWYSSSPTHFPEYPNYRCTCAFKDGLPFKSVDDRFIRYEGPPYLPYLPDIGSLTANFACLAAPTSPPVQIPS